jgi:Na+/H+ antiporter NhaB
MIINETGLLSRSVTSVARVFCGPVGAVVILGGKLTYTAYLLLQHHESVSAAVHYCVPALLMMSTDVAFYGLMFLLSWNPGLKAWIMRQLPHDLMSVAIRSQGEKLALAPLGTPEAEGCGLLLLARSRCLFTARGLTRQILPFLENFLFWQFSIVFCDFLELEDDVRPL